MTDSPENRHYHGPHGSIPWMTLDLQKTPEKTLKPGIKARLKIAFVAINSVVKEIATKNMHDD